VLLPELNDVVAAEDRIRPHVAVSPLWHAPALSAFLGAEIYIKGEALSPLASFKLRGAMNHLLAVAGAARAVTSSTGNHGQGVAFAARLLGMKADIFLPHGSPQIKRDSIEKLGATLHVGGADLDAAKDLARAFADANKAAFIDDGESPQVIAGAGTVGLEIARQLPDADFVFTPVGAGCLAAGTAMGLKAAGSHAAVIGVQSAQTPCMILSFHAKRAISHDVTTICDCLNQRIPPELSLAAMIAHCADAMTVEDSECLSAMKMAMTLGHMLIEPGTAASLAGAWKRRAQLQGKKVVLVFSGANVDAEMISRAMASPDLGA
jgi:threonine dehydratase